MNDIELKEMLFLLIAVFGSWSYLTTRRCINRAKYRIKQLGINLKFFPQNYIIPNRKIRKIFKLDKKLIAKYLYLEFWIAIMFALLFPINSLIVIFFWICVNKVLALQILFYLFWIEFGLTFVNEIFIYICIFIYKQRPNKKKKK